MTPLPNALGGAGLIAWRLDRAVYASMWDSGEGGFRSGGRWNSHGVRAVYAALDPATAIVEVAVHKGFSALDLDPHVLTYFEIRDPSIVKILLPTDVPNPNWLRPGAPSAGQQSFGDDLLATHVFLAVPSVVSTHSWNLVFDAVKAAGFYELRGQERFALDPRLNPPSPSPTVRNVSRGRERAHSMPRPPKLGNLDPSDRMKPAHEDDLLEIPAFLRRTAK